MSSISFGAGQVRANNTILQVTADGSGVDVYNDSYGPVPFILDVNGWYE